MFGTQPRARRPLLLILVFGALLAIIGVTATAQSVMVSLHFSTSTLNTLVASDSATVRAVLNDKVKLHFFDPAVGPSAAELTELERQLAALTRPTEILRVEIRRLDGTIVAASQAGIAGTAMELSPAAADAGSGQPSAVILPAADAGAGPGAFESPSILREFLPITTTDGQVHAIVGIWRDAIPVLGLLDRVRRDVVAVTLTAAIIAAIVLYLIFRSAQGRLTRQTAALVESTRRDPLTDTLNHGALVSHLALEIERARASGAPLGVALIDIDNFRLLNDNHGHRAGDQALLAVVGELRNLPESIVMGRYGPDEFLLVAPAEAVVDMEPAIERLRTALADLSLQFEATERLPVTISAGLCTYPEHGSSVTVLLAAAARTLEEAKASGGDNVKVAGTGEVEDTSTSGFDILHGLILAVDTKDRYTKRHSEDVARYGVFLARRLGLDPELVSTIHLAGLLHDVGKIGIPDPILRKPGKLTDAEYEIVKQHVALGDMIVRDVPDIEIVRAGIRHHHERWDGDGYLTRLAGEEIPLIARILAVGDAFSAMTTTRPYRKALDLREALTRLEDASGSQLDERLVKLFVEGIETAADAPLPGADVHAATLWMPRRVA